MTHDQVYELGPQQVSTEMIEIARDFIGPDFGKQHEQLTKRMLELCQEFYRRGAFNMEHRDGTTCMAEDQGGHPCCAHPAEFFVGPEHLDPGDLRQVYCRTHRNFNRFYRAEHMNPIYESKG